MSQITNKPLPEGRIWFVRADKGNALAEVFVEQEIVSISLGGSIGQLRPEESKSEIVSRLTARWPDAEAESINHWALQIKRFIGKMAVGDAVATYDSQQRVCHLGIIRGLLIPDAISPTVQDKLNRSLGYEYCFDISHRVEWQHQVSRDDLSGPAWRGLVNPQTLYQLSESTSAELRGLCGV